jgi:hypothetical protein
MNRVAPVKGLPMWRFAFMRSRSPRSAPATDQRIVLGEPPESMKEMIRQMLEKK